MTQWWQYDRDTPEERAQAELVESIDTQERSAIAAIQAIARMAEVQPDEALDDREMYLRRAVNFGQRELHSPIVTLAQSGQRELAQTVSRRAQALDANVREKLDRAFGERGPVI